MPPDTGPVITKLDPLHGPVTGGTTVTVTGVRLTGATAVSFGGTAATFTPDSDTQITATSPASATAGPVEVTVTTPAGTSVPMTWVYDSPPAQDRPSAGFDVEPVAWCWGLQAGCHPENGESVTFTSTSTDSDGTIVSEEWDFDGNLDFADASGTPVSHVFDTPGTYTVRLRVTDDDGATDTASQTVIVTDADADDDGTPNRQDCDPYDASRHPGAPDAPDLNSVDNDCDGIDGRVSQAVFVATPDDGGVDDPNRGTRREEPLATISYALTRAQSTGRQHVYVAGGTYQEALNLVSGISIYGGYRPTGGHCLTFYCEYWERPGAVTTIVNRTGTGGGVVTVNAANIPTTAPVTLQSLDIVSGSATVAGTSSIAVRATSSPGLTLEAVTVEAGNGAPGANGTNGSSGGDGAQGASPSPGVCPTTGATGGAGGFALGVSGGNGGNGAPQPGSGNPGVPGSAGSTGSFVVGGAPPGGGGAGGAANAPAGDGANGGNGGTGTSGAAGAGGTISAGYWSSNPGGGGTNGQPGGGGGGGGGAGSLTPAVGFDGYPGDGGGGGGAGGAAGTAASGGQGGGASFGILVIGANPTSPGPNIVGSYLRGSAIRSGDGGAGGIGAIGGRGGLGGAGGAGGTTCGPLKGGDGGRGGRGGDGGHGGGGAGGPSYAVYRYNSLVTIDPYYTRLFHGSGGAGGSSLGNAGTIGASGTTN